MGRHTLTKTLYKNAPLDTLGQELFAFLAEEGFIVHNATHNGRDAELQAIRNDSMVLGDVEAVAIRIDKDEDGLQVSIKVACYGKDMIDVQPDGIMFLENVVSQISQGSTIAMCTTGIVGMGALNAFNFQKKLLSFIENI